MKPGARVVPFNDDKETTADQAQLKVNLGLVGRDVVRLGLSTYQLSKLDIANWHAMLLEKMSYVPDKCYLGGYRGSSHPWLKTYQNKFGKRCGARPQHVKTEVEKYLAELNRRVEQTVRVIDPTKEKTPAEVRAVAEIAAWAHGEWARIHPFANGNGRTCRAIANWVLVRFRLSPVLGYRPRPTDPYFGSCRQGYGRRPERLGNHGC